MATRSSQRYTSAVFNFVLCMAVEVYKALRAGDTATCEMLLKGFFFPFMKLRERAPGYAVSLIKAGVRLKGFDAGGVCTALTDPTAEEERLLGELISFAEARAS